MDHSPLHTEDETFRKLKQSLFSIVLADMNKNGYNPSILYKHHWTYPEYIAEFYKHYRITDVELD